MSQKERSAREPAERGKTTTLHGNAMPNTETGTGEPTGTETTAWQEGAGSPENRAIEGVVIKTDKQATARAVGVLTSGGDASGMNAAIRSVIHTCMQRNVQVYGVYRGLDGLIDGDISLLTKGHEIWDAAQGGTILETGRCERFYRKEWRKEAAFNLLKKGINRLIVVGGGGTSEASQLLVDEFGEHYASLKSEGRIFEEDGTEGDAGGKSPADEKGVGSDIGDKSGGKSTPQLGVVLIPGTIDNDMHGTEITLGADTALNRIVTLSRWLLSTARSHRRVFIVECMGNRCGWLTLAAAFATFADYALIPEAPNDNWRTELLASIKINMDRCCGYSLVFLCEGAVDAAGAPITAEDVTAALPGFSTRILRMGHVQRAGPATAMDVILGNLGGVKAVEHCFSSGFRRPKMVAYRHGTAELVDLSVSIEGNAIMTRLQDENRFQEVLGRRDEEFQWIYKAFEELRLRRLRSFGRLPPENALFRKAGRHMLRNEKMEEIMTRLSTETHAEALVSSGLSRPISVGILNDGPPVPAMTGIFCRFVESGLARKMKLYHFSNGYSGLSRPQEIRANDMCRIKNNDIITIGTYEGELPAPAVVEQRLRENMIDYLIIIGGERNLGLIKNLPNAVLIPVSRHNEVQDVDLCIGFDTALNGILSTAEICKHTAVSLLKTLAILEISESETNLLLVMAGIACGACKVVVENKSSVEDVNRLRKHVLGHFKKDKRDSVLILKGSNALGGLGSEIFKKLLTSETGLNAIQTAMGPLEGGRFSSAFDELRGAALLTAALDCIENGQSGGMVRLVGKSIDFLPIGRLSGRMPSAALARAYKEIFDQCG